MTRERARQLAEELVGQMTAEEKAGQLRFDAPAIERLGIPEYNWWNEGLHGLARGGTATSFPQAIGMAAMFDDELLEEIASVVSEEARAKYNALSREGDRDIYHGLTMWSPNINIFRDPRWGRGQETYGEDPTLTARLGRAFVRGLQGKGETLKTTACAKHFAAHSGPEALRHGFDAVVSLKDLEETYLPAFHELVKEGVEAVMGAYNRLNGEPCCASDFLMKKLRGEWGFQGHFVSDCWAIRDFHLNHGVTENPRQSVQLALRSGCDLNCGCTYLNILCAMEDGMISEEEVTRSAVRLFTTRFLLGVLGDEGSEYDSIPYTQIECPEHLETAQKAALKSCVLLKNNGILPLDAEKCKTIGVIGPNADSRCALVGNYHGTASRYVTVLEGIRDRVEGKCRVLYSQGCALFAESVEPLARPNDRLAEAITVAKESDTVILVLGLDETLEGEEGDTGNSYSSGDKPDLLLPEPQRILLKGVLDVGKPTIVILLAGSAIDLCEEQERADAIMLGWYPGAGGGKAIAELMFGDVSPSGKLPITFYRNEALSELPEFTDYNMVGRTYRYYRGKPLYPFGFGLNYGDCEVIGLSADRSKAEVKVVNRGTRDTEDVLELYLHDEKSPLAPPNPILCGFKRIFLATGEEKTISVPIDEAAFTVVTEEGERIPGSGEWTIYAGFGGPDARTEELLGRKACAVPIHST
ncbi:MAG: glycoside hydrolase family 3 C-terminal domain-containing protein [Lachnospiraceae bacterium]|nr:glycoside hydrolase family 3 C-terminal domain-containing protein [Lachnospiraceae bacterium]